MTPPDHSNTPEPWETQARAEVELDASLRAWAAVIAIALAVGAAGAFWTGWFARGWFL